MLPGPTIIISCPHCGQYAKEKTLFSGNTFGATLWSDGKRIAPMLPDFPSLVLCKKCDQFYWVKDVKEIQEVNSYKELEEKWMNVDFVEFPTFHQYFKSLETISDEKSIRIKIWWSFNDYLRNNNENDITPDMQIMNTENLIVLLTLLDETNDSDLLMKAEVLCNLGRFEDSRQLLGKIKDPSLIKIKEKFLAEINKENIQVFRLY